MFGASLHKRIRSVRRIQVSVYADGRRPICHMIHSKEAPKKSPTSKVSPLPPNGLYGQHPIFLHGHRNAGRLEKLHPGTPPVFPRAPLGRSSSGLGGGRCGITRSAGRRALEAARVPATSRCDDQRQRLPGRIYFRFPGRAHGASPDVASPFSHNG